MEKDNNNTQQQPTEDENNYLVEEKIMYSRTRDGQTEYYLKRKRCTTTYGWYELNNCNINGDCSHCAQLITEFEQNAKKTMKDDEEKSSSTAEPPKQLIKSENGSLLDTKEHPLNSGMEAEKIIDAIGKSGELMFLVKFKDSLVEELVPRSVANAKFPMLVINYYQQRIDWYESVATEEAAGDKK